MQTLIVLGSWAVIVLLVLAFVRGASKASGFYQIGNADSAADEEERHL